MTQHQHQAGADEQPMAVESAHIMKREKHQAREHYERMLQELKNEQQK